MRTKQFIFFIQMKILRTAMSYGVFITPRLITECFINISIYAVASSINCSTKIYNVTR